MTLEEFLKTKPATLRIQLQQVLDVLASHEGTGLTRQFALNIERECRLNSNVWNDIVQALLIPGADVAGIVAKVTSTSGQYILQGGIIPHQWRTYYGRAVTKDQVCRLLMQQDPSITMTSARRFVTNLTNQDLNQNRRKLRTYKFGRFVIWATFHPIDVHGDPFEGFPNHADGIRDRLGLSKDDIGQEIVLFIYSLPAGIEPLFPTLTDSCAGSPWNYHFRPTFATQPWGFTMPWDDNGHPCPEIVHKPVTGATLASPLRIIKK